MVVGGLTVCVRCKVARPASEFRPNPRMRSGLNSWCKSCCLERTRQWRAEYPDYEVAHNAARRVRVARPEREKACLACDRVFVAAAGTQPRLCPVCRRDRETARVMARQRFARGSVDLRPADVARLKAAACRCPLCGSRMSDEIGHPRKKHLDHIVPRNVGGRHTPTNVRVICATCNLARPDDGSDLVQLVLG